MEKKHKPLPAEDRWILRDYLSGIAVHPDNTRRLFAVGFLGLPGTGKSTLANALSIRLDLPVNRSDQIRRFLNDAGFPGANPRQDIMATLAEERTAFFYRNRTSAVIDADFSEYAAASRTAAATYGASLLLVRVVCPDDVALARLARRSQGAEASSSAATADDFARIEARNSAYAPIDDPYASVDTTEPLEGLVDGLHHQLVEDDYVAGPYH